MSTDLSKFGVTSLTADRPRRMIMSIEGQDGVGKSSFALSAPGPILIVNIDRNLEGLLSRYIGDGKQIDELRLNVQREGVKLVVGDGSKLKLAVEDKKQSDECIKYHGAEFRRFMDVYALALRDRLYRTIVIDSGTDLAELMKLATFGRVEQVAANLYTLLNADWSEIFNRAKDQQYAHLLITHKYKEEWLEKVDERGFKVSKPSGKMLPSFWKGIPYAVQARIGLSLKNGVFNGKVIRGVDQPGKLMEISGEEFEVPPDDPWSLVCGYLTGEWEGWD